MTLILYSSFLLLLTIVLTLIIKKVVIEAFKYPRQYKSVPFWHIFVYGWPYERMITFVKQNNIKHFYRAFYFNRWAMIAVSPEAAKCVLTDRHLLKTFGSRGPQSGQFLFRNNVVGSNGADWKRQRTFYSHAFNNDALIAYFPKFKSMTKKVMTKLKEVSGGDIDIRSVVSKFTIDVLGLTIFDLDFKALDDEINTYYESYNKTTNNLLRPLFVFFPWLDNLPFGPGAVYKKDADNIRSLLQKIIEDRKNSAESKHDILSHLIQASSNDEKGLSQTELISNVFILFLAGHDTTAASLNWLLYEMSENIDIQQKLRNEVFNRFGKDKDPNLEELEKFEYLNCVLLETLRRHPPVANITTRLSVEDIEFQGDLIPKGTQLGIDIFNIHHNSELWEDPYKFNPDRFLPQNKSKIDRFAFLPFLLGPRQCIGNQFSLIEQCLFLVKFLQNFESLPPKNHVNTFIRETGSPFNNPRIYITVKPIN